MFSLLSLDNIIYLPKFPLFFNASVLLTSWTPQFNFSKGNSNKAVWKFSQKLETFLILIWVPESASPQNNKIFYFFTWVRAKVILQNLWQNQDIR